MFTFWRQPVEVRRVDHISSYSSSVLVKTKEKVLKIITIPRILSGCLEIGKSYQFSFFYGEVKEA